MKEMPNKTGPKFDKAWWKAALLRSLKTFIQTLIGSIGVGQAIDGFEMAQVIYVSLSAAILSLATSIGWNLPECSVDGDFVIVTNDPNKDVFSLELYNDLLSYAENDTITLKVISDVKNSQK